MGAYPYRSAIWYGSARTVWQNLSKGGSQAFYSAVEANTNGWSWTEFDYKNTKTGVVYSYMNGDVIFSDGSICSIDYPTDTTTI